jgi:hypothetical protein
MTLFAMMGGVSLTLLWTNGEFFCQFLLDCPIWGTGFTANYVPPPIATDSVTLYSLDCCLPTGGSRCEEAINGIVNKPCSDSKRRMEQAVLQWSCRKQQEDKAIFTTELKRQRQEATVIFKHIVVHLLVRRLLYENEHLKHLKTISAPAS